VIETTYREALGLALRHAMAEDPTIVIIGEEVGAYGGAYGVTKGLMQEFGKERVIDSPISEAGFVGAAVGAAMTGLKPVAELMYVDFAGIAMDQIANQAAKIRYMFGGQMGVPMVLRTQGGTGRSAAAQHSQSLEGWFLQVPGLRVALPGTVSDAYHLLRASLRQPDPVIFIEHKALYVQKGKLDPTQADAAWGRAALRRQGEHVTVVTYSRMLNYVLTAAENAASHGIETEIIDLRTLNPLDFASVTASVTKTGKAIVVTEACITGGPAAEISARIQEECFDFLEEPIVRIGGEDVPIPVAPALEASSIPSVDLITEVIRKLVRR
jgi:acetoin:2,6-dichlorophenolindophenol oxidoreductase subunit beta